MPRVTPEPAGDEIAVVGLAGRFPGAPDVPSLWRNLLDGVDAVHDHTSDELRALGIAAELIADPQHVRGHGRLAGAGEFLEQSSVALEDAGYDPSHRDGTVGVFAGSSANRYFLFRVLAASTAPGHAPAPGSAPGGRLPSLPGCPFQRRRYWLQGPP